MGTYKSDAGAGAVWVESDRTGGTVRARYQGYPEGFQFQPGDETGIELANGEWRTVPSVVHTIRLQRRVEWWTRNRWSGEFRFLTQMRIDTRPLPPGRNLQRGLSRHDCWDGTAKPQVVLAYGDWSGSGRCVDGNSGVVRSFACVGPELQLLPPAVRKQSLVPASMCRAEPEHQVLDLQWRPLHVLRVLCGG